jgi:membrane protease subunit HflK
MNNQYPQDPLDELIGRAMEILKNSRDFLFLLPLILLAPIIFSSFYTVQPDEEAVVLRFGKYLKTAPPGLHFKIPMGVDQAIKVKTKLVLQQEFGFRTRSVSGSRTSYQGGSTYDTESLMLTGDLNVADVEWITQFQIAEPQKYLFNVSDPEQNIRDISEAVMRRVVGDKLVTEVLTVGRAKISSQAKKLTQDILNQYDMGIRIVSVKLQDVNPPEAVKPSFNEVNAAKQEQEQSINNAEKFYNQVIPEARGLAEKQIAEAQGYATELLNTAKGDAEKFTLIYQEYRKAPQITKDRMYLETTEKIFKNLKNITVVDPKVQGLLPVYSKTNKEMK